MEIYIPQLWKKSKSLILEGGIVIDRNGINSPNLRVNVPNGTGPELEIKQLTYNSRSALGGGIRLIKADNQKHYQLGWATDDTLTLYAADQNDLNEVCKFTKTGITGIVNPSRELDAVNKRYVDAKKPVIAIWATAAKRIHRNRMQWNMGMEGNLSAGYMMPVSGRIKHGSLSITYPTGAEIHDPNSNVVCIVKNTEMTNVQFNTNIKQLTEPFELAAGDIVNFKSIVNIHRIGSAVVTVLIELDI